jgi:hypothetical protein
MKKITIVTIVLILLISSQLIQGQTKTEQHSYRPSLSVVFGNGFLHAEHVIIRLRMGALNDSLYYDTYLNRPKWVDDINFFELSVKPMVLASVTVEIPDQKVVSKFDFLIERDTYLYLSISHSNEIFPLISDERLNIE